jgi:hypothetical protein
MATLGRSAVLLAGGLLGCSSGAVERQQPDVLLVVMDTVRADAHAEAHTPAFDQIAAQGSAPRAWAPSTWTAPSTVSLMTGMPVYAHGWDFSFPRHLDPETESYAAIPEEIPTLGEVMSEAGYQTVGIIGNQLLSREIGWQRGFSQWIPVPDKRFPRKLRKVLDEADDDTPLFLYLHLRGAHYPCLPSEEAAARWDVGEPAWRGQARKIRDMPGVSAAEQEQYRKAYRAKIEDVDARVGKLIELASERGDGVVIITSDHGELLGEHGEWGHDHWLWEPLNAVPLAARGLGELPPLVSTTGLAARIAAVAGAPGAFPPETVVPLAQREGRVAVTLPDGTKGIWDERIARGTGFAAFDVVGEPEERQELWHPLDRAGLVLAREQAEAEQPHRSLELVQEGIEEDMLEMLEDLGYMGG